MSTRPTPTLILHVAALLMLGACQAGPTGPTPDTDAVVVRVAGALDGTGGRIGPSDIVVVDGRISGILPHGRGRGRVYDLGDAIALPGLIDTHVHIGWHFNREGRTPSEDVVETPEETILFAAENAWVTLQSGVTTVQSLGAPADAELRNALQRGLLPGPRILTSLAALGAWLGDEPETYRERVRELAAAGADVIKVFGSASIRDGGPPTLSQEQLDAICGEAAELGLRAVVHAHGPESARRAALAGCTTIEHGALLDRETLELLAEHEMFYDPNIDLVLRNYFENQERFMGVGNYTEEGFAQMRAAAPKALAAFKEALDVPGLRVVFGTDAIAGSHGRNYEELVYRVETGGQPAMDAVISATSLAAESLGLGNEIGTLATGMVADIIATSGNPAEDIRSLGRVRFVMREGRVVRQDPPEPAAGS
jgi:imidazolonepropionase-like amidohydrolase